MRQHVTVVGALHIGFGVLGVLIALVVFVSLVGAGLLADDDQVLGILTVIGTAVAFFFLLLSVPGIVAGIGLLKYKPWARILVMVLSVLHLLNIPIGTAVGGYSLWVLMLDETTELFTSAQ